MKTKLYTLLALALVASLLTACATSAAASGLKQSTGEGVPRTVSVTGSGKVYLTPDIAYIMIGVHSENKDAAVAVSDNNKTSKKVTDALKAEGVDAKDIQTTNFSIYPQQQFDAQGRPTGEITYMVDNTIYMTLREIDKIGEILDAAVTAGANTISGIQFDVADRSASLSEARKLAVEDAEKQASELAAAAGVQLGPVQSISSYSGAQPIPMYEKGYGGGGAMAAAQPVPISPGQMVIQLDVNVVYAIQ